MKTLLQLTVLSLFLCFQLFAQEQTLVGSGEMSNGGFGGPVIKYTQIKNEPAVLVGGRGGWIINHTFVIGGGGYGLANQIEADYFTNYNQPYIDFGYGGLELEYIIQSDQLVHFSIYTLIGAGGVHFRDNSYDDWDDWYFDSDEFFVLEPALNVEVNITSFFRINAGANYRYISGLNYNNLNNEDFSGFSGVLTLKFGSF
jgi:hypothetical protein